MTGLGPIHRRAQVLSLRCQLRRLLRLGLFASVSISGYLLSTCALAAERVDYLKDVKPILKARCYACHGALKQESGLRLDTAQTIRKGGDSGGAIVPETNGRSLLIERISAVDESQRMPPDGEPLSKRQVAVLTAWIEQGAPAPEDERPAVDPREHWAFKQPARPDVPVVANAEWIANPIDAFIAAKQQRRGLLPLPPAQKEILVRRVYLDLIGLPPDRNELHAFLADNSPLAYETIVDRLLESRHYGERWGRHWMDVWRYSDWYGRRQVGDVRNSYPHIWRWRDWIIDSLNDDKGYDQMVREMLAADELHPSDDSRLPALGFIVRNWFSLNYDTWKQDLVEHTGKAFLALRFNCAHCHDHKYDPISQEEYFRFRAFFEPLEFRHDRVPGGPALTKYVRYKPGSGASLKPIAAGLPRVYDLYHDEQTFMYRLGDTRDRFDRAGVSPAAPAIIGGGDLVIERIELPPAAWYPASKRFVQLDELQKRRAAVKSAREKLALSTSSVESLRLRLDQARTQVGDEEKARSTDPSPAAAPLEHLPQQIELAQLRLMADKRQFEAAQAEFRSIQARIAADKAQTEGAPDNAAKLALAASKAERRSKLATTRARLADANKRAAEYRRADKPDANKIKQAEKDAAASLKEIAALEQKPRNTSREYTRLGPEYPRTSTGRRRALANWIASRDNPLTARVAVNHIWMRHFGRPLVESVFDFGLSGEQPSHPELLDWLAVEFMTIGWSMKQLHRLIVTSNTYRRSSRPGGDDHPNFRIDKDNTYWWKFDRRRLESEIIRDCMLHVAGQLDAKIGGPEIQSVEETTSNRRSVYFTVYPEAGGAMRFMTLFDPPDPSDCYRRTESIVPQQALALANSVLALNQGRSLADNLSKELVDGKSVDDDQFIVSSFEQVLCRKPTTEEHSVCRTFLKTQVRVFQKARGGPQKVSVKKGTVPAATDPVQRARESLVRTLFNHNDFITLH